MPEMPGLLHDYLQQATEGKLVTRIDSRDLQELRRDEKEAERRSLRATSGGALFFSGALLTGLEVGPWFVSGLSGGAGEITTGTSGGRRTLRVVY